jgi:hypothetical protein
MVKYFAMAAALVTFLVLSDLAEARGPGCPSCSAMVYGAPVQMATTARVPPRYVTVTAPAASPVVTAAQPTARYYTPTYYPTYVRRGWYSRR